MQEIQNYFSERAIKVQHDNDEKINVQDYFAFLHFVFKTSKLSLFEHENDTEDFFFKATGFKTILIKIEDYLRDVQNICNINFKNDS